MSHEQSKNVNSTHCCADAKLPDCHVWYARMWFGAKDNPVIDEGARALLKLAQARGEILD